MDVIELGWLCREPRRVEIVDLAAPSLRADWSRRPDNEAFCRTCNRLAPSLRCSAADAGRLKPRSTLRS